MNQRELPMIISRLARLSVPHATASGELSLPSTKTTAPKETARPAAAPGSCPTPSTANSPGRTKSAGRKFASGRSKSGGSPAPFELHLPDEDRNWKVYPARCPVCGQWPELERRNTTKPADLRHVQYRLICSNRLCRSVSTHWVKDSYQARLAWITYSTLCRK